HWSLTARRGRANQQPCRECAALTMLHDYLTTSDRSNAGFLRLWCRAARRGRTMNTEPMPSSLVTVTSRERGKAEPHPAVAARRQGICLVNSWNKANAAPSRRAWCVALVRGRPLDKTRRAWPDLSPTQQFSRAFEAASTSSQPLSPSLMPDGVVATLGENVQTIRRPSRRSRK